MCIRDSLLQRVGELAHQDLGQDAGTQQHHTDVYKRQRMNGCELPVIINSGSGNQGITCSVPLIEYAKELHSGKEKLYRALIISNLVAIHEKTGIGTLSAYLSLIHI